MQLADLPADSNEQPNHAPLTTRPTVKRTAFADKAMAEEQPDGGAPATEEEPRGQWDKLMRMISLPRQKSARHMGKV